MDQKQKDTLNDMADYIVYGIEMDIPFIEILATLGHDAGGILTKQPCFLPRSHGFSKHLRERGIPKPKKG